ncbi:MAG: NAD(P)/FAD-dependent oxidoreductase [Komarekiella atlantica HA4396-MV6]|jgi:cation diffusion facilitator CzcD-associated flavoprotein CzcO|nr:NAD(P)/FAD-dependent oxidoreductase [Komarekiella atlantica HA4396-MV6]
MNNQVYHSSEQKLEIAIIGAGISGLCMAINLKKVGINSFKIFEKADSLGGTWRDNTYPGAGCDVPSFLYSFSFELKYNWTLNYPKQPEILQYLEYCAEKYGIKQHIQFNTEIITAIFEHEQGVWSIHTRTNEKLQANILISGCGQLNRPKIPDIDGINTFQGTQFHSARWKNQYNLSGKTVAVIGTGASAIQFIPLIAKEVKKLFIFQSSANWILNKQDHKFTEFQHWIFKTFPFTVNLYRLWIYLTLEFLLVNGVLQKDGITGKFFAAYLSRQRHQKVKQAALQSVLEPNFQVGCKRVLLSNDYYETLQQPNVEVISSRVKAICTNSVLTQNDQKYRIDTLIFATGFHATNFLSSIKIIGLNNQLLEDKWKDGAEAYKGILISGFPNLFMLYGPNTNTSNSIIFMIECQVRYIISCIRLIQRKSLLYLDVKPSKQSLFNQKLQVDAAKTVWSSNCTNWYKTDKGKIVNNWPQSTLCYLLTTFGANSNDFYCLDKNKK